MCCDILFIVSLEEEDKFRHQNIQATVFGLSSLLPAQPILKGPWLYMSQYVPVYNLINRVQSSRLHI